MRWYIIRIHAWTGSLFCNYWCTRGRGTSPKLAVSRITRCKVRTRVLDVYISQGPLLYTRRATNAPAVRMFERGDCGQRTVAVRSRGSTLSRPRATGKCIRVVQHNFWLATEREWGTAQ